MLRRDTGSLIARARQRGPGLLAIGISLGLHGVAFAGLLLLREVAPPKPHAVIAVELVHAVNFTGPPGGSAAEQLGSLQLPKETSLASTETADNTEQRPDPESAPSEAPNASASPAVEPVPKPIRDSPPPTAPENASHRRDPVSRTHQDPSAIAETASALEELTAAARAVPPAPRRKPSPPDPSTNPSAVKGRIGPELGRTKDTSPESGEQEPAREVAKSALDRLAGHGQQTAVLAVQKVHGVAPLPANVPGGGLAGKLGDSAGTAPRYAGRGLVNAPPRYPYLARRRGQEGRAVLRVTVTADGEAAAVRLHESSGYRLLDEAAIEAIKEWRFIPAERGGISVAGSVDVPISFKLTD